jgi:ribose transport system permease protein
MAVADEPGAERRAGARVILAGLARALSIRNISALYVAAAFLLIFAVWIPDLFFTSSTWKTLLNEQAIVALVAVGLVIPLAAGAFDLSIGLAVGTGGMIAAWLIGRNGMPVAPAVALALLSGTGIGLVNAALITGLRIDSFIATLAVSSCLTALVVAVSDGEQIIGLPASFQDIAGTQILGITLPVYLLAAIAVVVWYVMEHTPPGRYVYATGGNPEAARLTGVPTRLVVTLALTAGSTIAALGGVLVASNTSGADPSLGVGYLLPAFSAAFLGSTQIRNGSFNVWGTVLAVYVLAMAVKGLQLGGAPVWLPDLFNGVALAIAVALATWQGDAFASLRSRRRRLRFRPPGPARSEG